jgi:CRISPR/Cas system endoribonuclease Cas6 (RAMP superfamily)
VKAFISPLKIIGTKEIKKVAYDCGIGEKNSMEYGMIYVSGK